MTPAASQQEAMLVATNGFHSGHTAAQGALKTDGSTPPPESQTGVKSTPSSEAPNEQSRLRISALNQDNLANYSLVHSPAGHLLERQGLQPT